MDTVQMRQFASFGAYRISRLRYGNPARHRQSAFLLGRQAMCYRFVSFNEVFCSVQVWSLLRICTAVRNVDRSGTRQRPHECCFSSVYYVSTEILVDFGMLACVVLRLFLFLRRRWDYSLGMHILHQLAPSCKQQFHMYPLLS